jgi:long-chain acyl-CoA synthetase
MAQQFALDYPEKTMYQLVKQAAEACPRSIAYVFQGKKTSYTRLLERIDAAAKGLYRLGIRRGDRVTLCLPNCPQMVDCLYALNRIGAVANLIHPLSAGSEIAFYLSVSGSKAILTLDTFYEKVAAVLPRLDQDCKILVTTIGEELPLPLHWLLP